ncbi:uncharacterized protein LOC131689542 [Topomyia yanbarensis]|uniref:uncharacterized protein LOC131689542 n=1 Tax=Topomyia yanbarensis TaxID=2498891 RepID=UPI00273C7AC6|nr:uncharacterized protein LOC131689542 [Topomyia yanbarensis]
MTVTVSLVEEKPQFGDTIPTPEPHPNLVRCSGINNGNLKSKFVVLQIVQIILGILTLVLVRSPFHDNPFLTCGFMFLAFNTSLLSATILWDALNEGKLRQQFELEPEAWNTGVLYYTGIVGLLYYVGSYGMCAMYIDSYNPLVYMLSGVFGMVTCCAYAYHWWLQYNGRLMAARSQEATMHHQSSGEQDQAILGIDFVQF